LINLKIIMLHLRDFICMNHVGLVYFLFRFAPCADDEAVRGATLVGADVKFSGLGCPLFWEQIQTMPDRLRSGTPATGAAGRRFWCVS